MANLRYLLLALLFAGVAQIKSAETDAEVDVEDAELFKDMPDIGPRIPLSSFEDLFPEFFPRPDRPSRPVRPTKPVRPVKPVEKPGLKDQLPTPKDGCGLSEESAHKIVGGSPAKPGQYPWMALIGYIQRSIFGQQEVSFNCGGSLITSRHVLTAAHCVNRLLYMVRLGEHDYASRSDKSAKDIRVVDSVPHSQWNQRLMINDIAILHLDKEVDFTDRIRPICLPIDDQTRQQSFIKSNPFVAGWGTTREDGQVSSVLRHVQVPVITNAQCMEKYDKIGMVQSERQFGSNVICAGYTTGGKDSCQGDSGGPLMLPVHQSGKFPFYQIGVVSYGVGCARRNIPGIYTNVQHYADWLKQNTR